MENKKNVHEVNIKIEKDEFESAILKAFDKKKEEVKVDGFRKGKVPFDIYVKKFGKESLYMDAVDILLPSAYKKAIESGNYVPIIEPKIDLKSITEDGVEFSFVITTMPEVKIKKYTGLKVKKGDATVTDDEVSTEISNMLKRYSELRVKEDGSVELGDTAVIDFEGFKDGKAFDGGKGENYPLEIGSNTFIPGFEDQVIGMKKDEEKDINVTFPEEYPSEELKGQPVVFKVKVNEIKEKVERELDEEFFEDLALPGVDSKETLEAEVRKNMEVNKNSEIENAFVDDLLKEIAKNTEVEIPEELIEEELHHMIHHFEDQMRMQGISLEVYYEITKSSEKDLKEQMMPEAKNHILYRFILDAVKENEKITVEDKEVDEEIKSLASQYQVSEEEFLKMYGSKDMMKYELEVRKTLDFLKENN